MIKTGPVLVQYADEYATVWGAIRIKQFMNISTRLDKLVSLRHTIMSENTLNHILVIKIGFF